MNKYGLVQHLLTQFSRELSVLYSISQFNYTGPSILQYHASILLTLRPLSHLDMIFYFYIGRKEFPCSKSSVKSFDIRAYPHKMASLLTFQQFYTFHKLIFRGGCGYFLPRKSQVTKFYWPLIFLTKNIGTGSLIGYKYF